MVDDSADAAMPECASQTLQRWDFWLDDEWWRVTVDIHSENEDGWIWRYAISSDCPSEVNGQIETDCDSSPTLLDILADWQWNNQQIVMQMVALDAKIAKEAVQK